MKNISAITTFMVKKTASPVILMGHLPKKYDIMINVRFFGANGPYSLWGIPVFLK
jgi:hypothetical protein